MSRKNPSAVALGRKGGQAFAARLRQGLVPHSGGIPPKPAPCPRCGEQQPSGRAALRHCKQDRL